MLENTLFLNDSTYSTKPKSLYKWEPITVQLNPAIILAGVLIMLFLISIGIGFNESYTFLISGV